jgi:energy-coupling factor transporter ATP-binding protein EcfA2
MIIVELALINIRNFKEAKKIILKPGLNLILGGNGSGKTTLFNVFKGVLFPSYEGFSPEGSSQAAISFKLNNGEIYRLLRHFSKQSAQLYKLNPSANKFILLEKDDEKIQNFLLSLLKIEDLSKEQISSIFSMTRSSLPSLGSFVKTKSFSTSYVPEAKSEKGEADSTAKASLEELKKQEAKADQLSQKESEMLDYKDRIFSIKKTLSTLESIESDLSSLSEKESIFPGFTSVPRDINQLIEDYEKTALEKNNEEQQLIEEKEIIEQQLSMDQQNLLQNKFLWAGGAIVLIAIFLPFFLDVEGILKQIDLIGLLVGIGLALFSLFKDFNKISQKKIWGAKLENKNKNLEMLNARFQREHSKYFDILNKTESANRDEFETKFSAYRQLKDEEKSLLEKKESILANKSKEALLADLIEASEKADAAEREINQLKPGTRDPYIIQQEIKALEDSLSSGKSGPAEATFAINAEEGFQSTEEPSKSLVAFFENAWDLILKRSGLNYDQIHQLIEKKISFVAGHAVTPQVNENGTLSLGRDENTLSPGTVDQIFWSLFLSRLELLKNIPLPLLLDDPLITLDPVHQALVLSSLKELSKDKQIILFSSSPYPVELANLIKL